MPEGKVFAEDDVVTMERAGGSSWSLAAALCRHWKNRCILASAKHRRLYRAASGRELLLLEGCLKRTPILTLEGHVRNSAGMGMHEVLLRETEYSVSSPGMRLRQASTAPHRASSTP